MQNIDFIELNAIEYDMNSIDSGTLGKIMCSKPSIIKRRPIREDIDKIGAIDKKGELIETLILMKKYFLKDFIPQNSLTLLGINLNTL